MSPLVSDAILSLLIAGQPHCTAFLVAPDRAVTAAHCVVGEPLERLTLTAPGGTTPAHVLRTDCLARYRLGTWDDDLALLTLEPAPVSRPLQLCLSHCFTGGSYSFAGYGGRRHGPDEPAVLRRGIARIARIGARLLWLTPAATLPCFGDSGAPLLAADGRVVGIHLGGDQQCRVSAWFLRLDAPALRPLLRTLHDGPPGALVASPC
jgi:hypothetical protein